MLPSRFIVFLFRHEVAKPSLAGHWKRAYPA
jgi:hypothetical protein